MLILKTMKYAFNIHPDRNSIEVELNSFQLIIHEHGQERTMPYSAITDVRLERRKDIFFMTIHSLDYGSVRISNRLYSSSKQWHDQSRQYQTLVRILHLHLLKTQCEAEFCAGFKPNSMPTKFILITILSSLVYFIEDYFDIITFVHPVMAGFITLVIGILLLMAPYLRDIPKSYSPSDIPLNMLPPPN
jgi:hypothetical protein